jgi:hypothetical protein
MALSDRYQLLQGDRAKARNQAQRDAIDKKLDKPEDRIDNKPAAIVGNRGARMLSGLSSGTVIKRGIELSFCLGDRSS